ncbi:hypothetical protein X474_19110 [Dethiosulfatarculus sandiegensis]|uniref:Uncharacterized protein n=1 Tax=Dethiosulfatarculus sandiegensis TaxID=1429043 RepID=A0A0D2HPM8_9BACT|nr:hypothetical protein X474_19110 [Dethiosulfatarculus sandiegensis]
MSRARRLDTITPKHRRLIITRQCALMRVSRSSFYYHGKGESPLNLKLMRLIDEQWLKAPFFGSRRMRKMGLEAVYPRPKTTRPHPKHPVYPHLPRGLAIDRPNQV